jgi:hypothetical protein
MLASACRHLRGNLVAYMALLVALSSTSYAAATTLLLANSVGTRQVINHSLLKKDFKARQICTHPTSITLAPGAKATRPLRAEHK